MKQVQWIIGMVILIAVSLLLLQNRPASTVRAQSGTRSYQQGSGSRYGGSYQQGSSSRRQGMRQQGTNRAASSTFESKFWNWLQQVQYHNWAPGPGKPTKAYPGQSPHGKFLKTYLNRIAAGNPKTLPDGSIIIKENFGPDGKTLMAITVMYKASGFNPEAGDWYWVKYTPDGRVARTPPEKGSMPISGKFASCIDCHSGAEGNDFSFSND